MIGGTSARDLIAAVLLIGGIIVLAWIVWTVSDVLLLGFAAVLFAIVLRSLASLLERIAPVRSPWSLFVALAIVALLVVAFVLLLGVQIRGEASTLAADLPAAIESLGQRLGIEDLPAQLGQRIEEFAGRSAFTRTIVGYGSLLLNIFTTSILVLTAGVYLAFKPASYRKGALKLVPEPLQGEAERLLDNTGLALRRWLLGQLISMAIIAVLTAIGLSALGVPSALALALLAGLAGFVPVVGPILSAIPALLIALSVSDTMVLWVVGLYILVQLLESNVIMPLVQRKVVDLPPVLALFAILAFGVLFGPLGVLFGTPLAVALLVVVKQLYIEDALDRPTSLPADGDRKAAE